MKQMMMITAMLIGLTVSANAQGKIRGGNFHPRVQSPRPQKVIVVQPSYYGYSSGLGYRLSPFYNPYNSFYSNRFNDPFYSQRAIETTPSELQLKFEGIENNYDYEISTVRHNKGLSGSERRQQIRDLKHERDNARIKAKQSFYQSRQEKN